MQGKLGIQVHGTLFKVGLGTVVEHLMCREGVKLVELVGHQHLTKGLVLTCPEGVELSAEFRYPGVEFAHLVGLPRVRLEKILVFLVQVFKLMLKSFHVLLLSLPKCPLRCSVLSTPPLPGISLEGTRWSKDSQRTKCILGMVSFSLLVVDVLPDLRRRRSAWSRAAVLLYSTAILPFCVPG